MLQVKLKNIEKLQESRTPEFKEGVLKSASLITDEYVEIESDIFQKLLTTTGIPNLSDKIKSFTTSTVGWVSKGAPLVNEDQFYQRLKICQACDQWDSQSFGGTGSCKKCGCSTLVKLRMGTASCPLEPSLWGAV